MNTRGDFYQEAIGLQTNNAGGPGFGARGLILGAGVNASLLY